MLHPKKHELGSTLCGGGGGGGKAEILVTIPIAKLASFGEESIGNIPDGFALALVWSSSPLHDGFPLVWSSCHCCA